MKPKPKGKLAPATPEGSIRKQWVELRLQCPYETDTHRWYAYQLACRLAQDWSEACDRYRELTTDDARKLYKPTADHYANRITGMLDLLYRLDTVTDSDPWHTSRHQKAARRRRKDEGNGNRQHS